MRFVNSEGTMLIPNVFEVYYLGVREHSPRYHALCISLNQLYPPGTRIRIRILELGIGKRTITALDKGTRLPGMTKAGQDINPVADKLCSETVLSCLSPLYITPNYSRSAAFIRTSS